MPAELYRHYACDDTLLYVGISLSTSARLSAHKNREWFGRIARITVEHFSTRQEAQNAELRAIKTERPVHNIIGQRFLWRASDVAQLPLPDRLRPRPKKRPKKEREASPYAVCYGMKPDLWEGVIQIGPYSIGCKVCCSGLRIVSWGDFPEGGLEAVHGNESAWKAYHDFDKGIDPVIPTRQQLVEDGWL